MKSKATQFLWRYRNLDAVGFGQGLGCESYLGNMVAVLLNISRVMLRRILLERGCAGQDDDVAALVISLEIHRDFGVVCDVPQLMC